MQLKIVTPPTVTPMDVVGMDRLKEHLNEAVDVSDNDLLIESYLAAAWQLAESHTWRQFLTASWRYTLPSFYAQGKRFRDILIPRPPTQSIDSVKYIATDGTLTTMVVDTDYEIDDSGDIWSIYPVDYWPSTRDVRNAVQITFTAGYGNTLASIPPVVLHAIRLQVASWWMIRESIDDKNRSELPNASKALLESVEIRHDRLIA